MRQLSAVANSGQEDADFDLVGDLCDPCLGVGSTDTDGDQLCDENDNCPNHSNPGQVDADGDGFGDACDTCAGPGTVDTDGDRSATSPTYARAT